MADITWQDNQFHLHGELDFTNVMSVYRKSLSLFSKQPELILNFADLKTSNSVGLALIMEWIKYANSNQRTLRVINLSPHLHSIAKAAGVDNLIPITL